MRSSVVSGLEISYEKQIRRIQKPTGLLDWCIDALAPLNQVPARHHRLLIRELSRVAAGGVDRLMVFMPPNHAKTTYATILFPAWYWTQHPRADIIGASYGASLAFKFSRRIQAQINRSTEALGFRLETEQVDDWMVSPGGSYRAVGAGGGITGRRADLFIIDDPVKGRQDAESETIRDNRWEWYQAEVYTRLNPGARIILIQTRWHKDDLAGRLLEAQQAGVGDQWRILDMPALADKADDPLGRPIGAPLWPERFGLEALARTRAVIGEYDWGALYQGDPQPRGSVFFDIENCLVGSLPVEPPTLCDTVFATIDTAVKTGAHHDGSAAIFWALDQQGYGRWPLYILDWEILQIEGASLESWLPTVFTRLEEYARSCRARRGSAGAWIEDKVSGSILLQQAQRRGWPANPIDTKLTSYGKDERAMNCSGHVHAGKVKLTPQAYNRVSVHKGASRNHLLTQVFGFRIGRDNEKDDLLDAFTYGISIALGETDLETRK